MIYDPLDGHHIEFAQLSGAGLDFRGTLLPRECKRRDKRRGVDL